MPKGCMIDVSALRAVVPRTAADAIPAVVLAFLRWRIVTRALLCWWRCV